MYRLTVGVVVEDHAVFVPSQAAGGDHTGHILVRVAPNPLHVDQARGHIQHRPAAFPQVAFVYESIRAQPFAAQTKHLAVGKSGCGLFVFKSALGPPAGLRIVEFDAGHAIGFKTLPCRQNVFPEIRIGIVVGYQRLMMRMFHIQAGDIVEQHVAGICQGIIIGRQAHLEIGKRDAVAGFQCRAPLGKCFIRLNQMAVFRPVCIVPPTLLGVSVVIAISIRLEADGNFGVFRDSGLLPHLEFIYQCLAVVDVSESAQRPYGPTTERGKIIGIWPGLICRAHGEAVGFQGDKRIRLSDIQVKIVFGDIGFPRIHQPAHGVLSPHIQFTVTQGNPFPVFAVGQAAPYNRYPFPLRHTS